MVRGNYFFYAYGSYEKGVQRYTLYTPFVRLEWQFGLLVYGAVCLLAVVVGDTLACLDVGRGELYQAVALRGERDSRAWATCR